MKIILTAINAKYIHSNLAVRSLKSYAAQTGAKIEVAEYTINQQSEEIMADLFLRNPDVLCFSCYIWNITYVEQLVRDMKKVLPETSIWLGGPEVSYDAPDVLRRLPQVSGVMKGEGEATFAELAACYAGEEMKGERLSAALAQIDGITYVSSNGDIVENNWRPVLDLSSVPFIYQDLTDFENRIIYYESSRGCPFSCSYCLSSVDKTLRFRDINLVKEELKFFLDNHIPQVKFVDRTFNCNHEHAYAIWSFIKEHDNGVTNFHFEVAADLFREEELALIATMRPGLIQLEIGVQSTNPRTIQEIRRVMDFDQVAATVRQVQETQRIHQHLDLIAGLPYEDYERFGQSFNEVYAIRPEQLQLGFLKVLKGSYMEQQAAAYGLVYRSSPPYEVLATRWLNYTDVIRLKGVEQMLEVYYNSGQFARTLPLLEEVFTSPFAMYEALSAYYETHHFNQVSHSRLARYQILYDFAVMNDPAHQESYREALIFDLYLRENMKSRPAFAGENTADKEVLRKFYETEAKNGAYLKGYEAYDKRQLRKMTHIEKFSTYTKGYVLFDYLNRDPLTSQAAVFRITV